MSFGFNATDLLHIHKGVWLGGPWGGGGGELALYTISLQNYLDCAVLCCAVLCCAVLCCAVLCCAVLCCAVLCCAVLCWSHTTSFKPSHMSAMGGDDAKCFEQAGTMYLTAAHIHANLLICAGSYTAWSASPHFTRLWLTPSRLPYSTSCLKSPACCSLCC